MLKVSTRVAAMLSGLFLLCSGPAGAVQNIKWGNLEVHPFLSVEERYDDNIFLAVTGETGSAITQTSPGLSLNLPVIPNRLKLKGMYKYDNLTYANASSVNKANHHTADFGLDFEGPRRWTLSASDNYTLTTDPASSELTARAKRRQNNASGSFTTKLGHGMDLGVEVKSTLHDYNDSNLSTALDRNEIYFGPSMGYQLFPKTSLYVQYMRGIINYDATTGLNKDNRTHSLDVGVKGVLGPKLTGEARMGTAWKKYEAASTADSGADNTATYMLQVNWKAPLRSELTLTGERKLVESTFNRYYRTSSVGFVFSKTCSNNKLTTKLNGQTITDEYPDSKTTSEGQTKPRRDNTWQAGVSLDYAFTKWLSASASFLHRQRESNFNATFKYTDNTSGLGVKVMF